VRKHKIFTSSVDGYFRVFDIRKGEITKDFFGEPIISLSLPSDESIAAVSLLNEGIKLFDINASNCLIR
jgi:WD40 repeat protein